MTQDQFDPQNSDADLSATESVPGTADGSPTEGVEITEAEHDQAVEPDDNAFEVDGPQVGHA